MTGRLFESEFFPTIDSCPTYVSFKNSMNFVKDNQKWDVSKPSTKVGRDLFTEVAMSLESILDTEFDWSELQLFSALGTALDYYHGIDGFFLFRGKIITIDVTTNPNKDTYKANFILQYNHVITEDSYDFSRVAEIIAYKLISKEVH